LKITVFVKLHSSVRRRDQLESQLFEAEYFTDEDSVFVPADVAAVVHPVAEADLSGT
jgi:hypothetical protein